MLLKKSNNNHKAEMTCFKKKKHSQWKKGYYSFLQNFQSIISLHVLKLGLNKSMCTSDNEQSINKLWPQQESSSSEKFLLKPLKKYLHKNGVPMGHIQNKNNFFEKQQKQILSFQNLFILSKYHIFWLSYECFQFCVMLLC